MKIPLALAWDSLIDQYEASSKASLIELCQEFALCHYNLYENSEQWFIALDWICLQLKYRHNKQMDDDNMIAHILNNIPADYKHLCASLFPDFGT